MQPVRFEGATTLIAALLVALVLAPVTRGQNTPEAEATSDSLRTALAENRHDLRLVEGRLRGPGGRWLVDRAKQATIVSLGESHGTRQIPAIMSALLAELQADDELDHLAVEASPWTVEQMTDSLQAGPAAYTSLVRTHPAAIPFYNLRAERDLVEHLVAQSETERPLWGLDQMFYFATSMALDRLKTLAPTSDAAATVERLRSRRSATSEPAGPALPPSLSTPLVAYEPTTFDSLRSRFDGISEGQRLIDEITTSIPIYRSNATDNYRSNQVRARYMRQNLQREYQRALTSGEDPPQVAIKVGGRHAYRDRTPNNALDVGNLAVALADQTGGTALNVLVVCGPGSKGWDFPTGSSNCFNEQWEPFASVMTGNDPALFDLTALQPLLHEGHLDPDDEFGRLFWAFDAVVLVPNAEAATPLAPLVGK